MLDRCDAKECQVSLHEAEDAGIVLREDSKAETSLSMEGSGNRDRSSEV